jgi:hypothetical protein
VYISGSDHLLCHKQLLCRWGHTGGGGGCWVDGGRAH